MLKTYPDLQGIYALTSVALPGAAEALAKQNAQGKIYLTGLSTPNSMREYIKQGVLKEFVLWSPVDLGYLTVQAAKLAVDGTLTPETKEIEAGRLGKISVSEQEVLLGKPLVFNAESIDQYQF